MSVLTIDGLSKSFRGFVAVHDVSLELKGGELRGLIGANGAGKSTLLHLIYGRLQADRGSIRFGDTEVTHLLAHQRARLGMGLVFQVTSVFDDLTIEENLLLGALPKVPGNRTVRRPGRGGTSARAHQARGRSIVDERAISATASSGGSRSGWCCSPNRSCSSSTSRPPG